MSIRSKRTARARRRGAGVPSNQVRLPGTVGSMKPERGIALLEKWRREGDAEEDRQAWEALREEIARART